MANSPEHYNLNRQWESFATTDVEPVSYGGVVVTAEYFHLPTGADRRALFVNVLGFAAAAHLVDCNAVSLSTYRGDVSTDEYEDIDLSRGRPYIQATQVRRNFASSARVDVRTFDEVDGIKGRVSLLDIMVNSEEVKRVINENDGVLTGAQDWAEHTDLIVKACLQHIITIKPRARRWRMMQLIAQTDFVKHRIEEPPIVL